MCASVDPLGGLNFLASGLTATLGQVVRIGLRVPLGAGRLVCLRFRRGAARCLLTLVDSLAGWGRG